jgi:uncharacterized protein
MPVQVNIRHLKEKEAHLRGELPVAELDLENKDDLIHARRPLRYELTAQKIGAAILARGRVELTLDCECARCLKPFAHRILLEQWTAHLPLEGPEKTPVKEDLADLTPYLREDILLEFPQHPLCGADCAGLPNRAKESKTKGGRQAEVSSAWSALNRLKF